MTDQQSTFEVRLASLLDRYAAAAPVEVDASALATRIAARDARVLEVLGRTFVKPRWLVPALATLLLLLAMAVAVFIGARLLRQQPVVPAHQFSGALRSIGIGSPGPTAVLALTDGTLFATRSTFSAEPDVYQIANVATGEVRDVGRGLTSRSDPSLVQLRDGRVLVLGGDYEAVGDGSFGPSASVTAEIFDPATGETVSAGNLLASRYLPSVVQLADGRVLMAGGDSPSAGLEPIASSEIFDPATGHFSAAGSMTQPRFGASAVELPDGQVLFVGTAADHMAGPQTAEIFDPVSGTFHAIEGPRDAGFGPAVRVGGGRALLVHSRCDEVHKMLPDGLSDTAHAAPAELYDPSVPGFVDAPDLPHCVRILIGLPDGRAFVDGFYYRGSSGSGDYQVHWSGVYDPDDGSVQLTPGPLGYLPSAAGMPDGRIVFWPGLGSWGEILE